MHKIISKWIAGKFGFFYLLFSFNILVFPASGQSLEKEAEKTNQKIIFKDRPAIFTIAGNGVPGYTGNGADALRASLNNPQGIVTDQNGNLYFAEFGNHIIRKVDLKTGKISTIAGTGSEGFSGDGGKANESNLHGPTGLTIFGNDLYFADSFNNRIRKINLTTGKIETVAGCDDHPGYSGDGDTARRARLNWPRGICFDSEGNMYFADNNNHRVRKVTKDGLISTVAGNGIRGFYGDGLKATEAQLYYPSSVAVDNLGNLLVCDSRNQRIRRIDKHGFISTYLASGDMLNGVALCIDSHSNIFIADEINNAVKKLGPTADQLATVAGRDLETTGFYGDHGSPENSLLNSPGSVFVSSDSDKIYISDSGNNRIRCISDEEIAGAKLGDAPIRLLARSSSGLSVVYSSSDPLVASIEDDMLVIKGIGTTIITAHQAGNVYFNSASEVKRRFTVYSPEENLVLSSFDFSTLKNRGWFRNLMFSVLGVLFFSVCGAWFYGRNQRRRELEKFHQIEKIRIAQELHDNVGTKLTSINLSLNKMARDHLISEEKMEPIHNHINETISELRNTIWAVNKEVVNWQDLTDRIRNLFWRIQQAGHSCDFDLQADDLLIKVELTPFLAINLFRVVQEAINNSCKHSGATVVSVALAIEGKKMILLIKDNGEGFDPNQIQSGQFGLKNMKARIHNVNGVITIQSAKGQGTSIKIEVPLTGL